MCCCCVELQAAVIVPVKVRLPATNELTNSNRGHLEAISRRIFFPLPRLILISSSSSSQGRSGPVTGICAREAGVARKLILARKKPLQKTSEHTYRGVKENIKAIITLLSDAFNTVQIKIKQNALNDFSPV